MTTQTGVYPLLCATCHNIVGVINVAEFEALVRDGEVYVCDICMEVGPADTLEIILATAPEGEWAELTRQAIAAGVAAPLPVVEAL
ncbi:MAG: hypothetical protein JXA21_01805 [Anaerolineae bacterium]|nr:hypothetical protein [Anaerolineae bacterium]